MVWILGVTAERSDGAGSGTGWLDLLVFVLYAVIATCVIWAWVAWWQRNQRGVVQWGEPQPEKLSWAERWKRLHTPYPTPGTQTSEAVFEEPPEEHPDERERTA